MIELLDSVVEFTGLSRGALLGLAFATIQGIYVMTRALHFGWHFYIDHGFILVEGANHKERVTSTLKKLGKEDSIFAVGYPVALLLSGIFAIIYGFIGHFWQAFLPAALFISFVVMPAAFIRIAAKEKRNKMAFTQKLDGTFDEFD